MSKEKSLMTNAKLLVVSSLLAGCSGTVVNVDKNVVDKLLTEDPNLGQIAESNINHITQVCTENVDGFISGSEHILQIGASAAWSFCDYKDSEGINRRMVVSNQEIGKDENVILLPMRQTVDGKSAGFKDTDGNDHYIWAESSDGSQTIVFDFNENQYVLNNDEKQQLSDFVAHLTNVSENVSAAGLESLPTVRPTATETVMPTETPVPTSTPEIITVDYAGCTKENIEKFQDYVIPEEDLFNGKLLAYLRTQSKPFDAEKIMKNVPSRRIVEEGIIGYDIQNAPNFIGISEEAMPFRMGGFCGEVFVTGNDGKKYPYLLTTVEYPNQEFIEDQTKNIWIIGYKNLFSTKDGKLPSQFGIDYMANDVKVMEILTVMNHRASYYDINYSPLDDFVFEKQGDMNKNFTDFLNGNTLALDGKIVPFEPSSQKWYK